MALAEVGGVETWGRLVLSHFGAVVLSELARILLITQFCPVNCLLSTRRARTVYRVRAVHKCPFTCMTQPLFPATNGSHQMHHTPLTAEVAVRKLLASRSTLITTEKQRCVAILAIWLLHYERNPVVRHRPVLVVHNPALVYTLGLWGCMPQVPGYNPEATAD